MLESIHVSISEEIHIAEARREALLLSQQLGFARTDAYYFATAVTELATNIFRYASGGNIQLRALARQGEVGVEVVAHDIGPGIANIEQAMGEGFSTSGSLGCGLPGVSRLMDKLEICSKVGQGTQIRACKWVAVAHLAQPKMIDCAPAAPC